MKYFKILWSEKLQFTGLSLFYLMFRFKFFECFFVVDLSKQWNLITKVQLIYQKKNDYVQTFHSK